MYNEKIPLLGDRTPLAAVKDRDGREIVESPVVLKDMSGTLAEQGAAVLNAMASGKLTTDTGERLMRTLQMQASIENTNEFETRLSAVEAAVLKSAGSTP